MLGYVQKEGSDPLPGLEHYNSPEYQHAIAVLQRLARRLFFRKNIRTLSKMQTDDSEGKQIRKRNMRQFHSPMAAWMDEWIILRLIPSHS